MGQQPENPPDLVSWPLLALVAAAGICVVATLIDRFWGQVLGWNPEGAMVVGKSLSPRLDGACNPFSPRT